MEKSAQSVNLDLDGPVEIAPRIFWVGHHLPGDRFQCHTYLVEHGDQSVLVDPGSTLTFPEVKRRVEQIVPFSHVRYFVCSHGDPDITGAMPAVDALVTRADATIVTHWRTAALLAHLALRLPMCDPEAQGWSLDLGGRVLRFILTPYLHFAGAFATFDEATGTLFTSDLFGGFSSTPGLHAQDESYFEEIRAFHEHYMPSREILVHGLLRLEQLPIRLIAPQHGRIIPEPLVRPMIERLKGLECGIYLMSKGDTDVARLMKLETMLRDVVCVLAGHADFAEVASLVLARVAEVIPVDAIELYADDGATVARFSAEHGYRAEITPLCSGAEEILGAPRDGARNHAMLHGAGSDRVVVPLRSTISDRARAAAVLHLTRPIEVSDELDDALGQIAMPLGIAVEREALQRRIEASRDNLSRALADLTDAQAQLVHAKKLEAIGSLAAGVAHEINTPVQYVGDNVSFLQRAFTQLTAVAQAAKEALAAEAPADLANLAHAVKKAKLEFLLDQIPRALDQSRDGLSRIAAIVGAMKEFSHPSSGTKEPVDLAHAIQTTITVARNEWKYVAEVETIFDPALPLVPALRDELNQVILNLVVNAAHAIGDVCSGGAKGTIRICTRREDRFAAIEISDTGTGVPEAIRDRIFDPFFTTKPVGKGTGQGLAIARAVVVDRHGGSIELRSEIGRGSTFIVRLPLEGALRVRAASEVVCA